jgi:DNA-binding transcriptional LysR family regulator
MSPIQLRSFHAVATTGSFTAAARILRVSQPTVTTQVKALEEFYRRLRPGEPPTAENAKAP